MARRPDNNNACVMDMRAVCQCHRPAPESALASAWSLLSPHANLPEPGLLVTPHYSLNRATNAAIAGSQSVTAGGQAITGIGTTSLKRPRSGQKEFPDIGRQQGGDQQVSCTRRPMMYMLSSCCFPTCHENIFSIVTVVEFKVPLTGDRQ